MESYKSITGKTIAIQFFIFLVVTMYQPIHALGTVQLYRVKVKSKYGLINTRGEVVIKPEYSFIGNLGGGWALETKSEKYKYHILNRKGQLLDSQKYEDYQVGFCNDLLGVKKTNKWGFLDQDGTIVIPFVYDDVSYFIDGFTIAEKDSVNGILDVNGNFTPMDMYDDIRNYNEGFFRLKKKTENGYEFALYSAKEKKIVLPFEYAEISKVHLGRSIIRKTHGKEGWDHLVDLNTSKEIIPAASNISISQPCTDYYLECFGRCSSGLYILKDWSSVDSPRYAIVDIYENYILEWTNKFSRVMSIQEGYSLAESRKKTFLLSPLGETVCKTYDKIGFFQNGLAPIKQNNQWGFIDTSGKVVVPVKYDFVLGYDQFGVGTVVFGASSVSEIYRKKEGVKIGYVNKGGEYIWEPKN